MVTLNTPYDFLAELLRGVDPLVVGLTVALVQFLRWVIPGPDQGFAFAGRTFAVHPAVRRALPVFPLLIAPAISVLLDQHAGQALSAKIREGLANGIVATQTYNILKTSIWGA